MTQESQSTGNAQADELVAAIDQARRTGGDAAGYLAGYVIASRCSTADLKAMEAALRDGGCQPR